MPLLLPKHHYFCVSVGFYGSLPSRIFESRGASALGISCKSLSLELLQHQRLDLDLPRGCIDERCRQCDDGASRLVPSYHWAAIGAKIYGPIVRLSVNISCCLRQRLATLSICIRSNLSNCCGQNCRIGRSQNTLSSEICLSVRVDASEDVDIRVGRVAAIEGFGECRACPANGISP